MPASFQVGLNKLESGTAPRFVVVSGDEPELVKKVTNAFSNDFVGNYYEHLCLGVDSVPTLFTQGHRMGRETRLNYGSVSPGLSFDWLPVWLNQVKRTRLLLSGVTEKHGASLERIANTRGIHIQCNAPSSERARSSFIKYLAAQYGQSPTHINLMLNQYKWKVSPCIQLLDKLALLNMPLTSDTMLQVGVVIDPVDEFVEALCVDNAAVAMSTVARIPTDRYGVAVTKLSDWLDKLARVKSAQSFMKKPAELAFEVGVPTKETEQLLKVARRFEFSRINRIALALAAADKDYADGNTAGVLEILVSKW